MTKEEFVEQAKLKLSLGFSVIPVGMNKIPVVKWEEYQKRFPTMQEVETWSNIPNIQLGIVTGKISNLTVVDIEKGGDPSFLPQETMIVETGNKGAHYYYRYCEGVRNKARIKELVDIRSEGGYVVADCSETRIEKKNEKGETEVSGGKYVLAYPCEIAPFPKSLAEMIFKKDSIFSLPPMASNAGEQVANYPGYGEGLRNQEMTRYIGHVLTKIHPAKWDTDAWGVIIDANNRNSPPLGERELRASYESIKRGEIVRNPNRWANRFEARAQEARKEWENVEGDEIKLMSEVAETQKIRTDIFYPLGYSVFDNEIMGGAFPGDLISIAGMPGHGKTSLAMNFAMNSLNRGVCVLFFSYEVMVQFVWEKFKKMGVTNANCLFSPFKNVTGNVEWIEKKINEAKDRYDVRMVVIDHLGFLAPKLKYEKGANENYSVFLTSILRDLKTIAKDKEIVIVLPVHMRKKEGYKKKSSIEIDDIAHTAGVAQESDLVFLIEREARKDRDAEGNIYTGSTKITLAKNRRTGVCPMVRFKMLSNEVYDYELTRKVGVVEKDVKEEREAGNGQLYKDLEEDHRKLGII